jgi:hypothetical protein
MYASGGMGQVFSRPPLGLDRMNDTRPKAFFIIATGKSMIGGERDVYPSRPSWHNLSS